MAAAVTGMPWKDKNMKDVSMHLDRRQFFTRTIPAAALASLGCTHLLAAAVSTQEEDDHKFQQEIPPVTYLQWARHRHAKYIGILKHLKGDIGEERLLEALKRASFAENVSLGRRLSSRIDSMKTFAGPFRDENSRVGKTIVREIIEDSDTAFEMKITECLTETIFREADALDLGYACVCHADFGLPVGMEIDIRLIRDKTLMQGHDYCNHRYVLEG